MSDLWTSLSALEPSVPADQWKTAVDTPAPSDTQAEASGGYHDRPRDLEAFSESSKAPEAKRIKQGVAEDVELALLERVASVLETASSKGVILSAVKVLSLLRHQQKKNAIP